MVFRGRALWVLLTSRPTGRFLQEAQEGKPQTVSEPKHRGNVTSRQARRGEPAAGWAPLSRARDTGGRRVGHVLPFPDAWRAAGALVPGRRGQATPADVLSTGL